MFFFVYLPHNNSIDIYMKPELSKASFVFTQEGNTEGTTSDIEEITIDYEVIADEGGFFVLRTQGWSVDSVEELEELFNRIRRIHNTKEK